MSMGVTRTWTYVRVDLTIKRKVVSYPSSVLLNDEI